MSHVLLQCSACDLFFEQPGRLRPYTCTQCREAEGIPTVAILEAMSPCCREAYVRGILAEKLRENDRDSIRELGGILDRLRVPA